MDYYKLYGKFTNSRIKSYILAKIASKEGGFAYSQTARKIMKNYHNVDIGYGSYGCFNIRSLKVNITFGNYCCIADGVMYSRANHPVSKFTMHPILYNIKYGNIHIKTINGVNNINYLPLIIGHDVWIGSNVIILTSCCKIGNGSVIGAGSIVTKDVPPYSIVAGNPAKKIRMRFNDKTIKALEDTQWWNMSKEELIKNSSLLDKIVCDNEK